jgi:hypothetical protein
MTNERRLEKTICEVVATVTLGALATATATDLALNSHEIKDYATTLFPFGIPLTIAAGVIVERIGSAISYTTNLMYKH